MFPRIEPAWRFRLLFGLMVCAGCSRSSLPAPADPNLARKSLETMLETWQQGSDSEQLKNRTPAIVVVDDDWRSGLRLTKYEVKEPGVTHGVNVQRAVMLSLEDNSGKKLEKEATYIIGTTPKITISRSDREKEEGP